MPGDKGGRRGGFKSRLVACAGGQPDRPRDPSSTTRAADSSRTIFVVNLAGVDYEDSTSLVQQAEFSVLAIRSDSCVLITCCSHHPDRSKKIKSTASFRLRIIYVQQ